MKIKFSYIIALSAFLVAGCAAYFSVFGLSQLFAGASLAVVVMASSLEFSKIIAVSMLQRYWKKVSKSLKIYLIIGVFILVCITSAGIYGFLSSAYQRTASKYVVSENEISILDNKKSTFDKDITNIQAIITAKTKRVEQLGNVRTNQETRLDSAKSNTNRLRARGDIATATAEIQTLNKAIDSLNAKNSILLDSSNTYSAKAIELKSKSTTTNEIGPLKYLAALTGQPMDKVVNWFILLLIFVFDPLAVSLVISFNKVRQLEIDAEAVKVVGEKTGLGFLDGVKADIDAAKVKRFVVEPYSKENPIILEGQPDYFIPVHNPELMENPFNLADAVQPATVGDVGETTEPINVYIPEPVIEQPVEEIKVEELIPEPEEVILPEPENPIHDAMRELTKEEPVVESGEKPDARQSVKKIELNDIKEVKENRGFSIGIPNNSIQRVDSKGKA